MEKLKLTCYPDVVVDEHTDFSKYADLTENEVQNLRFSMAPLNIISYSSPKVDFTVHPDSPAMEKIKPVIENIMKSRFIRGVKLHDGMPRPPQISLKSGLRAEDLEVIKEMRMDLGTISFQPVEQKELNLPTEGHWNPWKRHEVPLGEDVRLVGNTSLHYYLDDIVVDDDDPADFYIMVSGNKIAPTVLRFAFEIFSDDRQEWVPCGKFQTEEEWRAWFDSLGSSKLSFDEDGNNPVETKPIEKVLIPVVALGDANILIRAETDFGLNIKIKPNTLEMKLLKEVIEDVKSLATI